MSQAAFDSRKNFVGNDWASIQPCLQYWSAHLSIECESKKEPQLVVHYDRGFLKGDHVIKVQKIYAKHTFIQDKCGPSWRTYGHKGTEIPDGTYYKLHLKFEDEENVYDIFGEYKVGVWTAAGKISNSVEFLFDKLTKPVKKTNSIPH